MDSNPQTFIIFNLILYKKIIFEIMKSNQTLGILFFVRKERGSNKKKENNTAKKKGSIYLRITIENKPIEISLKREVEITNWVPSAGRAKGNIESLRQINDYLNFWENRVYAAQKELLEKKLPISSNAIKNLLVEKPNSKSLVEVFEYHNAKFAENVGIDRAKSTLDKYTITLRLVKEFLKKVYGRDDIPLTELNYKFAADLEHFFITVRKCDQNTTSKYIRNLGKIVRMAVLNEWLDKFPFSGFKTPIRLADRGFLTEEELAAIESKEIKLHRIEAVRDIFVFSCYTGLAYADVANLTWDHILVGMDGEKWINIPRQKTAIKSRVPLLPEAFAILVKYKYDPLIKIPGPLLPILSNQKMNAYLKEIADICGINKNLTFHLARHTFATTITLTNGVPIETVSSMLGHTNIQTTQIYSKVVDKKISQDMSKLKDILSTRRKKYEPDQST